MIVDDDPEVRHALRLLFEFERFDVVAEASDGLQALPEAIEQQPDFVILDSRMPLMNGATAAALIHEACRNTRVVAFSAYLSERPEWADAFLNKDRITEIVPLIGRMVEVRTG
ncbi:MAG TPA: response regulator [Actinomycetota bacterium]|nr:response regulator [Actinomycetota bacterium]